MLYTLKTLTHRCVVYSDTYSAVNVICDGVKTASDGNDLNTGIDYNVEPAYFMPTVWFDKLEKMAENDVLTMDDFPHLEDLLKARAQTINLEWWTQRVCFIRRIDASSLFLLSLLILLFSFNCFLSWTVTIDGMHGLAWTLPDLMQGLSYLASKEKRRPSSRFFRRVNSF